MMQSIAVSMDFIEKFRFAVSIFNSQLLESGVNLQVNSASIFFLKDGCYVSIASYFYFLFIEEYLGKWG